jgi:hypothetical protein
MKTAILILAFAPFALLAQQSSLEKLATFSPADSNRAHVMVSGKAFEMMGKMEVDPEIDEQLKRLAASINGMEGYMDFTAATAKNMLAKLASNKSFSEYASFTKKNETVRFYVNEKDGVVSEMVLVATTKTGGYAASVYGKMDIRDVGKLYKLISAKGFSYLEEKDAK